MTLKFTFYIVFLLLVSLYGLIHFRNFSKPFKYLVIIICAAFVFELFGEIIIKLGAPSNYFLYHFSCATYILLNLLVYLQILKKATPIIKQLAIVLTIIAFFGSIVNSLFFQLYLAFPSVGISLHAFQTIVLALLAFQEMLKVPLNVSLAKQPLFWLNVGNLIFYAFTFLVFAFFNFFVEMPVVYGFLVPLVWFAALVMNACYFAALYLDKNRLDANRK